MSKSTCPVCGGSGTDGRTDSGPSLREGDTIIVRRKDGGHIATITKFKMSGIKLLNHGTYTVQFQDGSIETHNTAHSWHDLYQRCPRCLGVREIELSDLDRDILASTTTFVISGVGVCRAVEREGRWWKFKHPHIRGADLLALDNNVYAPKLTYHEGGYQSFTAELRGDTDVAAFEPALCDQHGWYEGPTCPECAA